LKDNIDPTKASERDIASNPKGLVFKPLEAAQLPRTLDSATAALVNGNFAIAAGLDLSTRSSKNIWMRISKISSRYAVKMRISLSPKILLRS
jgi:ABC-type metal ion transport system substrate-binding protein